MKWFNREEPLTPAEKIAIEASLRSFAEDLSKQLQEDLKAEEEKLPSNPGQKKEPPVADQKRDLKRLVDVGGMPAKAKELINQILTRSGPVKDLHKVFFDAFGQQPNVLRRFMGYIQKHPQGEMVESKLKGPLSVQTPIVRAPVPQPGRTQAPRSETPGGNNRAPAPGMRPIV